MTPVRGRYLCQVGIVLCMAMSLILLITQNCSNQGVQSRSLTVQSVEVNTIQSRSPPDYKLTLLSEDVTTLTEMPWPEAREIIKSCAEKNDYYSLGPLPKSSIIITFHEGESFNALARTIHSVVQRTPPDILEDIIVIDDFSNKDDLGQVLDFYSDAVFKDKVKIFRNSKNLGLIQSRLKGIRLSKGEVFVLMDSHSEVQERWIEPLLFEIKKNRKTLSNSFIDWMTKTDNRWNYKHSGLCWTVFFDWTLTFGWDSLSKEQMEARKLTDPIPTTVMIGAYSAMDREFFEEIGAFDEGMEFWGGENLDLPIRVWLFGGRVVSMPCSRVAHLENPGSRSYRDKFYHLIKKNYKRTVEVWFDDYKKYFYAYSPEIANMDAGNLTSRFELKKRALHNFSWYLENVYPELGIPDKDTFAWGQIQNLGSSTCLDVSAAITAYTCGGVATNQLLMWSEQFELRKPTVVINVRREFRGGVKYSVYHEPYMRLYNNSRAPKWIHWQDGPLMDEHSGYCLEVIKPPTNKTLVMNQCHFKSSQLWRFSHYTVSYDKLLEHGSETFQAVSSKLLGLKKIHSIVLGPKVNHSNGHSGTL